MAKQSVDVTAVISGAAGVLAGLIAWWRTRTDFRTQQERQSLSAMNSLIDQLQEEVVRLQRENDRLRRDGSRPE